MHKKKIGSFFLPRSVYNLMSDDGERTARSVCFRRCGFPWRPAKCQNLSLLWFQSVLDFKFWGLDSGGKLRLAIGPACRLLFTHLYAVFNFFSCSWCPSGLCCCAVCSDNSILFGSGRFSCVLFVCLNLAC